MPMYLIIGYHKTGTTVISKTIHHSIPGSYYHLEPRKVGKLENLAEAKGSRVIKIIYNQWKTRPQLLNAIISGETEFKPDKVVAIQRDPRDVVISSMMYSVYDLVWKGGSRDQVERWVECIRCKETSPQSISISRLLEEMHEIFGEGLSLIPRIRDTFDYMEWLGRHRDHFFVIRYEDFVTGTIGSLEEYLGFKLSASRDVEEVGRVRRTQGSGNWKSLMLPEDLAAIRTEFEPQFTAFGYTDWKLTDEARLDPAYGSEYIRRVAEEAFIRRASASDPNLVELKPLAKALKFNPTVWS